jgi:PAS domain S-box-containing protein
MNAIRELFSSTGFMPHGFCYQWKPALIWLHTISDTLIAAAYFSIPIGLIYLVRKKRSIPFDWMFICFGIFIAACGATHLMEVVTLWLPIYWISGGAKLITALASLPTAILLTRVVPQVLSLAIPGELRAANEELRRQAVILREQAALLDLSQDAILVQTIDGKNLLWNQGAERMYGWSRAEAIGECNQDLLRTNFSQPRNEIIEKLFTTGYWEGELQQTRRDGQTIIVSGRWALGRGVDGNPQKVLMIATNITARKRAEDALRESEDRYRDLVEHSSDLICTHDAQGILLSVNEAPLRILGYSREEMLNKPLRDFVTPETRPLCDAYLAQVQRDGFARGLLPVLAKSGEVRLWEYNNSLRKEGVSSPIVRGIAHDVTEQKRAEAAVRRSEEKFSKAFRSSPVEMVITTVEEGRFLDVNESFERNLGYCRNEVIGRTALEFGLWVDEADRTALVEELRRNGRVTNREIQARAKSGKIKYKLCSAEIIQIGGEKCLLAVSEDITERKQAKEQLQRSEAILAEGQKLTHTGSWIWNPASGELLWSRETFRIYELDPAAVKPTLELFLKHVHPEDRPIIEQFLASMVREKCDFNFDYRIVMPDRSIKYLHSRGLPVFTPSGELIEFVGAVMDVSGRKRREEELRRLSGQLLRSQDEERRKIARDLHDATGQELVALSSMLGHLRAKMPSPSRNLRKSISQCQATADRCIREIRTLSYLLHPPMLDESGLEDAIRHYVAGFAERTRMAIELDIALNFGRLPGEEELALFRVMQESLVNIHRHSGVFRAKVRLDRSPQGVLLEVSDNGRGLRGNGKDRNNGSSFAGGVGLQSMHERMKLVQGRLEITSGTDGTTVRATVPANA